MQRDERIKQPDPDDTVIIRDYEHLKQIIEEYPKEQATKIIAANFKNLQICQQIIEDPKFDIAEFKDLLMNKTDVDLSYMAVFDNADVINKVIATQDPSAVNVQRNFIARSEMNRLATQLALGLVRKKLREENLDNKFIDSLRGLDITLSEATETQQISYSDLPNSEFCISAEEWLASAAYKQARTGRVFEDDFDLERAIALSLQEEQPRVACDEENEGAEKEKGKGKEVEKKGWVDESPELENSLSKHLLTESGAAFWQTVPIYRLPVSEFVAPKALNDEVQDEDEDLQQAIAASLNPENFPKNSF